MTKTVGFALLLVGLSSFAIAGAVAPEVDTGFVPGSLVLVAGAALLIRSRLRR